MNEKMKNLTVRTLSGVVLVAIVAGAILLSQWSFNLLLLLILIGGMTEFYRMATTGGAVPQRVLGIIMGAILLAVNALAATTMEIEGGAVVAKYLLLYLLLMIPVLFICELFRKESNPAANIGATVMGVLYVALPLSLMCYIPGIGSWQPWVMLSYIFIIWSNDVFAYLVGMSIGRHRLCERLSPKKSWEGFFGGVVGAMLMGLVAALSLQQNVVLWVGLALVASISGVLGDLVESMFKRAAGLKDSGNVIPGHGGWLDRFDALLLSAPFVFVYMVLTGMI